MNNELLEYISNDIANQYQKVKDELFVFSNDFDDEKYCLAFEIKESSYSAYADNENKNITISLNSMMNRRITNLIIHEYAHHIAIEFLNNRLHNLEFAIINYCLRNQMFTNGKCFFDSYDIHEDVAFSFLKINASEFDLLIKNISFSSMKELTDKASTLAKDIRKKSIPLSLGD